CRRICPKCKKKYEPPKAMQFVVERMGLQVDEYYKGVGCKNCRNTGFKGRIALHELLVIDDGLREIVTTNPTVSAIRARAEEQGMLTLRYDGLRKVKEGLTTLEEVFRASDDGWLPKHARGVTPALSAKAD